MDEVVVRPAGVDDLDEVVALWAHYLRSHRQNPAYRMARCGLEERRKRFREHIVGEDSVVFVVEREDGGLDGMITCFVEDNFPYFMPPHYCRIQTPYVRPDARRKGNLRKLLAAAFRWARAAELTEIRLYSPAGDVVGNAIAEEMGFEAVEVIRRHTVDWQGRPDRAIEDA